MRHVNEISAALAQVVSPTSLAQHYLIGRTDEEDVLDGFNRSRCGDANERRRLAVSGPLDFAPVRGRSVRSAAVLAGSHSRAGSRAQAGTTPTWPGCWTRRWCGTLRLTSSFPLVSASSTSRNRGRLLTCQRGPPPSWQEWFAIVVNDTAASLQKLASQFFHRTKQDRLFPASTEDRTPRRMHRA